MNELTHSLAVYQTIRDRIIALEADIDEATLADTLGRLQRLTERGAERRRIARDAMVEVDIKKIAAPDFTVSVRSGSPSLLVIDEGAIPEPYWEPREPRLNRAELLADLKRGVDVPGSHLSNPEPVLSVRVR